MLPASVPAGDQEQVIAFFQQVAGDEPLTRVEIDWYDGVVERQRDFLQQIHTDHGSSSVLLVIKVRADGVDANDVLASPLVKSFEHVVVASAYPLSNERSANLAALTKLVETTVQDAYVHLAPTMGLDSDAWGSALRPVVSLLGNPIDVVEAANSLVEIQLEPEFPADLGQALLRRALARLLSSRSPDELSLLGVYALEKVDAARPWWTPDHWDRTRQRLESDFLIRDNHLCGWATWIKSDDGRAVLHSALTAAGRTHKVASAAIASAATESKATEDRLLAVTEWMAAEDRLLRVKGQHWEAIADVLKLIEDAKLARAGQELDALEGKLAAAGTTRGDRAIYWAVVGRYRSALGDLREAVTAYRRALELLERVDVEPWYMWAVQSSLARALRDSGRWTEAEKMFRKVLDNRKLGGDTPKNRGNTLHHFAVGLRDNGRWKDAEVKFREALQLAAESDTPQSRGVTLYELAKGLRDNGRLPEAEAMFLEASRLKKEGSL